MPALRASHRSWLFGAATLAAIGCSPAGEAPTAAPAAAEAEVVAAPKRAAAAPPGASTAGPGGSTGAAPSPAPDAQAPTPVETGGATCAAAEGGFFPRRSFRVGDAHRTYDLFVPPHPAGARLALLFAFHGDGGESVRGYAGLEDASGGKAIVVYPHGWGGWDLSASADNYDFPFILALRAELAASPCVDRGRVFAFGYSNGGFFANMLACRRGADIFRAIAVNGGGLYAPDGEEATYDRYGTLLCPSSPVGALVIHGTADGVVDYWDNGVGARNTWLAKNDCSAKETTAMGIDPCVTYRCGRERVGFCSLEGEGHAPWWRAAQAAWRFFSGF